MILKDVLYPTKNQARDTGMALALLACILWLILGEKWLVIAAVIVLIIDMTVPAIFKPFAIVWFGLSVILGAVMSRVILSVVFFVVITPIGLVRRLFGFDSLMIRQWNKSYGSAFIDRNYTFTVADIKAPY